MFNAEMHRNDAKLFLDQNKILQQQLHDQKGAFDIRQKTGEQALRTTTASS